MLKARRLRVLLVPDFCQWVLGTIAKAIVRFNPWIEGTVASAPTVTRILSRDPSLIGNFDLVHFLCPYASKTWLPRLRDVVPCTTSHHHVTDWEIIKHNIDGDAIWTGSQQWADHLKATGVPADRVLYIPNSVDADLFGPITAEARVSARRKLGLEQRHTAVGLFAKKSSNDDGRKGTDIFVRAICMLNAELGNVAAVIVGPGWQDLVKELRAAGLRVCWIPFIWRYEDMPAVYAALDFYWVTARVEGGPVTLLEAMSSQVCCVSTPVGLAREFLTDGVNGALVPVNDAAGFMQRTADLARDIQRRREVGMRGRETILQHLDYRVTAPQFRELYARAVDHFAARHGRTAAIDVRTIGGDTSVPMRPGHGQEDILSGFPAGLRRRIRMLDNLSFAETLYGHGQKRLALGVLAKEWLCHPLSLRPWQVHMWAKRFMAAKSY